MAKPSAVATAVSTWEERLRTSLTATRAKFEHAGGKGEEAERTFRAFLRAHLPPSFRVGQGEVIDSFGQRSAQADVLVADEDQPFEVTEQPQLMIIEGVTAGAEIKVALGVTELGDAIEKGRRFKKLTAIRGKSIALTSDTIRGEPNSDIVRYYTRRPFFVFAYENHVRINTILERLAAAEDGEVVPPVDALFSLDGVVLTNTWDGKGSAKYIDQRSGHIVPGWTLNDQHPPLVSLLFWLHITMPRFAVRTSGLMHYLLAGSSWVESDTTATALNELFMHSPATNPPAASAEWEE